MFTVQKRGLISLNLAAFKALGEPATVALLFDADEGIVALRKVPRTHPNAYHVRKQGQSQSYLVAGQGFASFNKIDTELSRRFVGYDYGDHVWGFVLNLANTGNPLGHGQGRVENTVSPSLLGTARTAAHLLDPERLPELVEQGFLRAE